MGKDLEGRREQQQQLAFLLLEVTLLAIWSCLVLTEQPLPQMLGIACF